MSNSMRLDAALVNRGLAGGRDKAKRFIADGQVTVNGRTVTKSSFAVFENDDIVCAVTERFVGRGGEKLQKALEETKLDVRGFCCVDIGASTGGFTDCLLQHGAARVYAVDVGHDQLASSLREDARVICMEGTDIRHRDEVAKIIADKQADLCTVDVSFISLTQIWDSIIPLLKDDGRVICLIKPQFEAGRGALSKRGVVQKLPDHVRVLQTLCRFWQEKGAALAYLSWSPVRGGEGNIEYIAMLTAASTAPQQPMIKELVQNAFSAFADR